MKTATETSAKAREAMKKFDTVRSAVVWKIASKTIPLPNKQVKLDTEYKNIRKAEEIKDRLAEQLSSLSRVVLFIAQRIAPNTILDKTVFKLSADKLFRIIFVFSFLSISCPVAEYPFGPGELLLQVLCRSKM